MRQRVWFERRFELGLGSEMFPELLERIRGTPARLEERIRRVPAAARTRPGHGGAWSIQEHVGHLGDLEPLWAGRLDDLLAGRPELRPADLENRATHEAGHNGAPMGRLLGGFRWHREAWIRRLDELSEAELAVTAEHPRLRQPMSVVDLLFFVAEHDDHHLAAIAARARAERGTSTPGGPPPHELSYPIGPFAPKDAPLTPEEREEMLRRLEEHPARISEAVRGLSDEQLDTPYRQGGWTVRQVVHHVVDSHLNSYVRFKIGMTEENGVIRPYDQAAWAEAGEAATGPIGLSLPLLEALHVRWVAFLRGLSADDFRRTIHHPELGRDLTLDTLLELYGWHCRHHETHITALREREGW